VRNRSPEVVLERAIASACARLNRTDWSNQVPVASGLVPGASDGRRAIDLIQRRGERRFELIELKVGSDTPLYAAVEAVGYAMIWLLTREAAGAPISPVLKADQLDVRVLAPATFYKGYDLDAIELALDGSIRALGRDHRVPMSFGFDVLDGHALPGPHLADEELLAVVERRSSLHIPPGS
jgi:hypothetical protein